MGGQAGRSGRNDTAAAARPLRSALRLLDVNEALVGERWQIGSAVLEVSEPRVPCWRLGVRMNDRMFPRRFPEALRPGPYLRIIVEGDIGAGDEIRVVERPRHDLTIRDVFRIYTR